VSKGNLSSTLLIGIVGAVITGYVVQNSALLGSPVQVKTIVGVIYLIVKDVLASVGVENDAHVDSREEHRTTR
jgi:hypothetical protein